MIPASIVLLVTAIASWASMDETVATSDATAPGDVSIWSRPKLTGNAYGARDRLADRGFTADFDVTYVFQGVAVGGLEGPLFTQFSDESDLGHTLLGTLSLALDTEKAALWEGGEFRFAVQGRAGRSVVQRAGSVAAVNNAALFPNVVDRFDDEALAITEVTYTQYFGETIALFGGLLNTAEGDENQIAGSALSNSHFLNTGLLYSLVEDATVPNVSLGGGLLLELNESISGSFSIFGTSETAGENPFDHVEGVTFSTEWTLAHHLLGGLEGAQTAGFLYGINAQRTDIAADPRLVLASVVFGRPIPDTSSDTWAFYYNAHQYLSGGEEHGWGAFVRFGISDGDPNPVRLNVAGGIGGRGLLPARDSDTWGLGIYYLAMSDEDLLSGLNVGDEVGAEVYYNVAVTGWLHVTLDVQVIDPALPGADTTLVAAVRMNCSF